MRNGFSDDSGSCMGLPQYGLVDERKEWKNCCPATVPHGQLLRSESLLPIPRSPSTVRNRDDFDAIRRYAIDEHEWETLQHILARPQHVGRPTLRKLPNGATCVLDFFLKRIRGFLAALSIPIVCLKRIDASIGVELEWRTSHSHVQPFRA